MIISHKALANDLKDVFIDGEIDRLRQHIDLMRHSSESALMLLRKAKSVLDYPLYTSRELTSVEFRRTSYTITQTQYNYILVTFSSLRRSRAGAHSR